MLRAVHAALVPRAVASSVDELLAGATARTPLAAGDAKSGSVLERVVIDGRAAWCSSTCTSTTTGRCAASATSAADPCAVWASGLLDALPDCIDHAVVGAAGGSGPQRWGAALLMRDVGDARWCPRATSPSPSSSTASSSTTSPRCRAAFWGWRRRRCRAAARSRAAGARSAPAGWRSRRRAGWPEAVPADRRRGLGAVRRAGAGRRRSTLVDDLRRDLDPLVGGAAPHAARRFLHGDWKLGNLGIAPDGRTVLHRLGLPGRGPVGHELGLVPGAQPGPPARVARRTPIDAFRAALERHGIATPAGGSASSACACSAPSCSSAGRRRSATTTSSAGGATAAREGARWLRERRRASRPPTRPPAAAWQHGPGRVYDVLAEGLVPGHARSLGRPPRPRRRGRHRRRQPSHRPGGRPAPRLGLRAGHARAERPTDPRRPPPTLGPFRSATGAGGRVGGGVLA